MDSNSKPADESMFPGPGTSACRPKSHEIRDSVYFLSRIPPASLDLGRLYFESFVTLGRASAYRTLQLGTQPTTR